MSILYLFYTIPNERKVEKEKNEKAKKEEKTK